MSNWLNRRVASAVFRPIKPPPPDPGGVALDALRQPVYALRMAVRGVMRLADPDAAACGFVATVGAATVGWPAVTGCNDHSGVHVASVWNVHPDGLPFILDASADGATGLAPAAMRGLAVWAPLDPEFATYIPDCRCPAWDGLDA